jgi:hypothetical protein
MTYACPAEELVADTYLLKLQGMQNKVLRSIGNVPWRTAVRNMRTALNIMYVRNAYITKLSGRKAEVIKNHENEHVRGIGQA